MENFKEIAEKCLAGELSGTFVLQNGEKKYVNKKDQTIRKDYLDPYSPYIIGNRKYSRCGAILPISNEENPYDIVDFIPDQMVQTKIKIDIPEGKVPVMEQTEKGVVITWKEKEIQYSDVVETLLKKDQHISAYLRDITGNHHTNNFVKKAEVLRKLINIRNYFGKPKHFCDGIVIKCVNSYCGVETGQLYFDKPDLDSLHQVIFAKKEHAEQAIKMLGDELKYLFEPW